MREPRCGVCAALSLLLSGFGVFSSLGHLGLLNLEVLDLEVLSLQGASMNGHAVNLKQQQLRMPLSLSLSLSPSATSRAAGLGPRPPRQQGAQNALAPREFSQRRRRGGQESRAWECFNPFSLMFPVEALDLFWACSI